MKVSPTDHHEEKHSSEHGTASTQQQQLSIENIGSSSLSSSAKDHGRSCKHQPRAIPIVTTPKRGLGGASSSDDDEDDNDDDEGDIDVNNNRGDSQDTDKDGDESVKIPSFHNSRGVHLLNETSGNSNSANNTSSSASDPNANNSNSNNTTTTVSADQERQILLLMLLAQVCALHDPTPRTFTVHVLELFERGILGRQSIHFLFELGLVPSTTPRMLPPSTTTAAEISTQNPNDDSKEDIFDLANRATNPPSPQTLRAREASAIRNSLEQHDLEHQQQVQQRASCATANLLTSQQGEHCNSNNNNKNVTMVASPDAQAANASSWAVEHHPLSLSRYQREFHQVRLLNSGSFGEVFQSTNKIDLKDYAVKRVAFSAWGYSKDSVTQVIREVHCLAQCDHPNVVRYYTSWLEPSWMTGSGATSTMMASSGADVRRQHKLLTDIQHMMLTGGADASSGSPQEQSSSEYWCQSNQRQKGNSLSPISDNNNNNHIHEFFQEQAATLRNRKFSIGSSIDSLDSCESAGSSYDETSSSDREEEYSAWSIEEGHATTTKDDSIFIASHRKEVWESSSSPRHACKNGHGQPNKKQQPARVKYRYQICLFIQMQLCHPATLGDWIRHRNSECDYPVSSRPERVETAVKIFGQILSGLNHIHKRGIVHRDLKPMNVFRSLENDEVFLIGDFGLSKLIHSATYQQKAKHHHSPVNTSLDGSQALVIHPPECTDGSRTWQEPLTAGVGTASYAAPEQVTTRSYGMRADIFSLGLILLEMLCMFTTEHERMQTFYDCRHRRDLPSWITEQYPSAAKIILACTEPDPACRPSAEELLTVDLLSKAPIEPTVESCDKSETLPVNTVQSDQAETLIRELQQKNEQLVVYEQKLEEKDRIISELQHELALLKLTQSRQNIESPPRGTSPRLPSSSVGLADAEVASSSSSSDGV